MTKKTESAEEKNKKDNADEQNKGLTTTTTKEPDTDALVDARRRAYNANKRAEKANEEIEELKAELERVTAQKTSPKVDDETLESLKSQVEMLSRQVVASKSDIGKLRFKELIAADVVPEGKEVTFTARNIMYVVASYRDYRGIEIIAPHKVIIFQYAASDIRKEGREESVKNFCQYTTNLRTEIEFLRNSPYYGITFSENTNEMMEEDVQDTRFKVRAATQLASTSPEQIFSMATQYNIPNWRNKSAEQLKILIVHAMANDFKKANKEQQDEIARRNILARQVINQKTE